MELSVETVERLLGIFHLVARFVDEGGAELGVWPATTSRRTEAGKLAGLDLRLDDLLDFHLPMPDVAQADVRVDSLGEATSNRELHRKLAIQRALFDARQIVVEDQTGTLMMRYLLNGDFGVMTMEDRVALEACTDLVRLEELADAQFGLLEHLSCLA